MKTITIIGPGCTRCNKLYEAADSVAAELKIEYRMEKVTDINKFADYGVMLTPALVVDNELKVSGSIPSAEQLKQFING